MDALVVDQVETLRRASVSLALLDNAEDFSSLK